MCYRSVHRAGFLEIVSCGYRPWDQNCRRTLLTQLTDRFFGRNTPSHGIFSFKEKVYSLGSRVFLNAQRPFEEDVDPWDTIAFNKKRKSNRMCLTGLSTIFFSNGSTLTTPARILTRPSDYKREFTRKTFSLNENLGLSCIKILFSWRLNWLMCWWWLCGKGPWKRRHFLWNTTSDLKETWSLVHRKL